MAQKIVTNLWFDTEAEEAAEFYTSLFENSKILSKNTYPENAPGTREPGTAMTVEWELEGQRFVGLNGGPYFKFTEAISLQIECKDQEEIDYFWEKLGDGGEEGPCGWIKDRFGLSWQVTPAGMDELFSDDDPERAQRAMACMLDMKKLDIAELEAAADGVKAG
jgi:predicted 3-demethylubiquinone-9 3-methyltransferase (glyoxalase superfamily)